MNAGQIAVQIPVGVTMPGAMQTPSTSASSPTENQDQSVFAGVLRGVSPRESSRPTGAAKAAKTEHAEAPDTCGTVAEPVQQETPTDATAALLARLVAEVQAVPLDETAGETTQNADVSHQSLDVQLPQNVVVCAAQSQITALQQVNGRMPEVEMKGAVQNTSTSSIEAQTLISAAAPQATASMRESGKQHRVGSSQETLAAVSAQAADGAVAANSQHTAIIPETVEQKPVLEPGLFTSAVQPKAPVTASTVQRTVPATTVTQNTAPIITDNKVPVMVSDRNAETTPRMAVASAQIKTDIEDRPVPVNRSTQSAAPEGSTEPSKIPQPDPAIAGMRFASGTDVVQKATTAPTKDIPAVCAAPPEMPEIAGSPAPVKNTSPEAAVRPIPITVSDSTAQAVQTAVPFTDAVQRPNLDAYFQTSVRPVAISVTDSAAQEVQSAAPLTNVEASADVQPIIDAVQRPNLDTYVQTSLRPVAINGAASTAQAAQTTAPLPVVDAPTDVHPAIDAGQRPAHGEAQPHAELMAAQEQPAVRQGSTEAVAKPEVVAVHAVVGAAKEAATTTSGEEFGRGGNGFGDQNMNSQIHLAMSHQVKFDTALPVTGTTAAAAGDPLRNDLAEQVVSQVKDHITGREIKTGVEQVVIRLSPENLGELKMNLRMENQRLKVEIVAETSMVRDTLMKHSDTLKESLARQNITMESFDVSTGGNKQGTASQGQGDWRELARQRQYNAWAPAGGYKLGDVTAVPARPLYQASAAHSMVDVHF